MSEIVTGNTDALAAEYVLGTLDPEERTQAQALLESDQDFTAKVRLWERRLGELHLMVEPVEPDGKIWERIKAKMPELVPAPEASPAPAIPPPASEALAPAPETPVLPIPEAARPAPTVGHLPPTPTIPLAPGPPPAAAAAPSATTVPPPAPTPAAPTPAVTPPPLPPAPKPAVAPVLTPGGKRTPDVEPKAERKDQTAHMKGRLTRWRAFAVLMLLLVLAVAALLSAWRFVPERVPPVLRPAEVLRVMGVTVAGSASPRRPVPPESQFDE